MSEVQPGKGQVENVEEFQAREEHSKGTKTGQVGMVVGVETVQLIVTEAERIRQGGLINEAEDVCRC